MLYCLVNNTYHITDFRSMFSEIEDEKVLFLMVPVNIDYNSISISKFINLPSISLRNINQSLVDLRTIKSILKDLESKVSNKDSLLVFSEINITNQVIIEWFYKIGAGLFLLEDGMSSPILFNTNLPKRGLKIFLIKKYLKLIFGLSSTVVSIIGNAIFYFSPDHYFKCYIQTKNYISNRNIEQFKLEIKSDRRFLITNDQSAVFFNQPLYLFYTSPDQHYHALKNIVSELSIIYSSVFFKLHPSETKEHAIKVSEICNELPNVTLLSKDMTREEFLDLNVSHGVSYLSTALKEYEVYGLVPIYIYHLFPELLPDSISIKLNDYLNNLGYQFIQNLDDLENFTSIKDPKDMYNKGSTEQINEFSKELLNH